MADNVAITPGLGVSVRTEDQSGAQVQIITVGPRKTSPFTEVAINISASGDNSIVSATSSQTTKLYGFFLSSQGAVDLKWKDGAGTDLHPVISLLGKGSAWFLPRDGNPWFTGTANTAFILNLSAAVQVSGRAYYIKD